MVGVGKWRLPALALLALLLPALVDLKALQQASDLFVLAADPQPYFVPQHALLLYVRAPLAALSAFFWCLAPGMLLAAALGKPRSADRWVLTGFGLSLVINTVAVESAEGALGRALGSGEFLLLLALLTVVNGLAACLRHGLEGVRALTAANARIGLTVAVLLAAMAVLTPKIYWESFNADGHEAFETSRLMLFQMVPFWTPESGRDPFPGITTMLFAFPGAWFVRLFGESEAAARLPFFLYLGVAYSGLAAAIDWGKSRPLGLSARAVLWIPVLTYLVVQAYSVTYSPYHADLASPGTQDTLFLIALTGYLLAFWESRIAPMLAWQAAGYFCWPTGLLMPLLMAAATCLAWRPIPLRRIAWTLGGGAGLFLIGDLAAVLLSATGLPAPGGEHGWRTLIEERIHVYQLGAWLQARFLWDPVYLQRWLWIAVPCGFLPFLALFLLSRQCAAARSVAIFTGLYFVVFYVQSFVQIHYFAPVMLLPLVVFWRLDGFRRSRLAVLVSAGVATLCLGLSLPRTMRPIYEVREVGSAIESRLEGFDELRQSLFPEVAIFQQVIPVGWEIGVPEERFGFGSDVWSYYAYRGRLPDVPINYVIQRANEPPPNDLEPFAVEGGVALYVLDEEIMRRHRLLQPPHPSGSPIYSAPRWTMFKKSQPLDETVREIGRRLGLD